MSGWIEIVNAQIEIHRVEIFEAGRQEGDAQRQQTECRDEQRNDPGRRPGETVCIGPGRRDDALW
ncbi:MAG: hypothetical protein AB7I50_02660 [Vicinamibacterales bacterium]